MWNNETIFNISFNLHRTPASKMIMPFSLSYIFSLFFNVLIFFLFFLLTFLYTLLLADTQFECYCHCLYLLPIWHVSVYFVTEKYINLNHQLFPLRCVLLKSLGDILCSLYNKPNFKHHLLIVILFLCSLLVQGHKTLFLCHYHIITRSCLISSLSKLP